MKIAQTSACFSHAVRYDAVITYKNGPARGTGERRSVEMKSAIHDQCILITVFPLWLQGSSSLICRVPKRMGVH
ncbi:hypothetical protein A6V36_34530 [Paraburkholderia ginsengiterrae]|uniref:Uncharacterized protein n=1 Tax=Paraburkholderia ginsengiterrae TaxID=1462993 RepID=A0A1A9N2W2_9BURK|nr:hypothetical protein A6V37_33265 [Paraburkholderia ginsengiterrae]OAJ55660.1 hypothetical protein A6V36_34530 [Paraburkholderia ginsengiterrae]